MVLGIGYDAALAAFGGRVPESEGYDFGEFEQVLAEHGWATARKWKHMRHLNRDREIWPVAPWADLHQCEVQTTGNHSVLMLRDGTVIDPLTPEPKRLSDYKHVYSIAALTRIPQPCQHLDTFLVKDSEMTGRVHCKDCGHSREWDAY